MGFRETLGIHLLKYPILWTIHKNTDTCWVCLVCVLRFYCADRCTKAGNRTKTDHSGSQPLSPVHFPSYVPDALDLQGETLQ
jgi:hypothetical protein